MNEKLATINELLPIAERMRERQEAIGKKKLGIMADMAEAISLASEQGQDCLLAKVKIGRAIKWSDWLNHHVPNLPEGEAAKYERISTEQISDVRQCLFAFLPPAEREEREQRTPPKPWEVTSGIIRKLSNTVDQCPLSDWPQEQAANARKQLQPIVSLLWPEKFGK